MALIRVILFPPLRRPAPGDRIHIDETEQCPAEPLWYFLHRKNASLGDSLGKESIYIIDGSYLLKLLSGAALFPCAIYGILGV